MEQRLARLEARLEAVESELAELRQAAGLPPKAKKGPASPRDQEFLDACIQAAGGADRARISNLRQALGWDAPEFDDVLDRLHREGRARLYEDAGMSLSLKAMGDAFLGDDGKTYTEVGVVQ